MVTPSRELVAKARKVYNVYRERHGVDWSDQAVDRRTMMLPPGISDRRPGQGRSGGDSGIGDAVGQPVPSRRRCASQAIGRRLSPASRFAVKVIGWRSRRMAVTISGARKLSRRIRVK